MPPLCGTILPINGRLLPSRLLKYSPRKRKAMLGEFDFSDFLLAS